VGSIVRGEIAVRLIEERARLGYSQSGFARQLEVSHEGLRKNEMGQSGVGGEFLARAAKLGADVQYILTGVRSTNLQEVAPPKIPQLGSVMKSMRLGSAMKSLTSADALKPFRENAELVKSLTSADALKPFKENAKLVKEMTTPVLRREDMVVGIEKSNVMQLAGGNISGETVTVSGNTLTMINTPRHVTRTVAEVKPGVEHITEEQAARLTALVKLIVEWEAKVKKKPNGHRGVWAALNAHCRVTKYRLIGLEDYDKAENYLHQWLGRLQSMASAPVADNDTWRKRRYAYIKINTRENEAWLLAYLRKNFKAESLTDLADDALDRTYRAVAARKRRN